MAGSRPRRGPAARAVAARLAVVLVGLYVGVLGAVMHRARLDDGPLVLPWGLVLGLGAAALLAWTASLLVRAGAAWFALGWTAVLLLQGLGGAGSYLVGSDGWGWAFMGLGLSLLVLVVVLAPGRHRRPPRLVR
ncbi:hypothetical protein ASD11_10600 [Aeromicrobium sp. Root495]|uniref:hypothetical protein n=1 Tax=Aeromicrobium sp. Root495 TaxID=1736550 RepID=UPI0007010F9C|nr:hypothetical protein [Aeromicrobium sp. Root495]KQY59946.1 hypothetical protein ASD11_10600 [Aeromicrobium sp. Root495]RYJ06318.1 MAG: hypothetical protein EON52_06990 [Actinomycetales bacterium]